MNHIPDHYLVRYHLGMVVDEKLAALKEHLLACPDCVTRAEKTAEYIDAVRGGLIDGNPDLE